MANILVGKNRFYIEESGEMVAEITVVPTGEDKVIIDHTFVSEKMRGQGIAAKLVERVVEYARVENKRIIPLCSYARKQMIDNNQFHDVLVQ